MRRKTRITKNIFLFLTVFAVIGLGLFIWMEMPEHFRTTVDYIEYFATDRIMDAKKIIGFGLVILGFVLGIIWIIRNLRAGRKLLAFMGPFLFNALIFFGLIFYRDRPIVLSLFKSQSSSYDREEALIFTVLAVMIIVCLLTTIIVTIVEENTEYKPVHIQQKKPVQLETSPRAIETRIVYDRDKLSAQPHDHEDLRKEIAEIKKLILEVRELVVEKGLQGRKVLVKKLVTEEIAIDEPEKELIISPIPSKEEPVAVVISEEDEIKPVDVEEPIVIDGKVDEKAEEPVQEKTSSKFVASSDEKAMKVIRKPFDEKMAGTDDVNKANYNILKNELLSYGTKSRISHAGDTFRFKRETYAKLSLVGKNLKIYLALNPKEYSDTTIPAKDVSAKKCFEETPTMLHVRSRLSVKRAKLLIEELMKGKQLKQEEVKELDYASEFVTPKKKKAKIVE